jgi:RHS repeat-associated protein
MRRHLFQLARVPFGFARFAPCFEIAAMTAKFSPDLAPAVLQDMKIIVLNFRLWINRANGVKVGLPMIDIKARELESEPLETFQKGFDGDSQRVKKVEGGVTVFYIRSSINKQAMMEIRGNGAMYRTYVYAGGKLVAQQSPEGQFYWQHTNHLGSVHKLTSSSGAVVYRGEYDPHGNVLLETGSTTLNSHKFTEYEKDQSTGLDYANARMYSGSRGRFTKPDPIGLKAADSRPQSLNLYSYVNNDPINLIDPTGLNADAPDPQEGDVCQTGRTGSTYDGVIGSDGKCHYIPTGFASSTNGGGSSSLYTVITVIIYAGPALSGNVSSVTTVWVGSGRNIVWAPPVDNPPPPRDPEKERKKMLDDCYKAANARYEKELDDFSLTGAIAGSFIGINDIGGEIVAGTLGAAFAKAAGRQVATGIATGLIGQQVWNTIELQFVLGNEIQRLRDILHAEIADCYKQYG